MQVVTTHHGTTPTIKPFAWSYSKMKNFESCPQRHFQVDLKRAFQEEEGEALLWGNAVHSAAAKHLKEGVPLPPGMEVLQRWCERLRSGDSGQLLVEQRLAITKTFAPCEWFSKLAWFRGVADVIKVVGPIAAAFDWKTGKILEDGVQLALMAACVFAHHPDVQKIRTEFVWLKEDATTRCDFARDDMPRMWAQQWHRIEALEAAYNTQHYPPKPGGLCKRYCPVTSCEHHGSDR